MPCDVVTSKVLSPIRQPLSDPKNGATIWASCASFKWSGNDPFTTRQAAKLNAISRFSIVRSSSGRFRRSPVVLKYAVHAAHIAVLPSSTHGLPMSVVTGDTNWHHTLDDSGAGQPSLARTRSSYFLSRSRYRTEHFILNKNLKKGRAFRFEKKPEENLCQQWAI